MRDYPPGPWTAEVMRMIVKERVAEIRQSLIERSIADVETIQRMDVAAQEEKGA